MQRDIKFRAEPAAGRCRQDAHLLRRHSENRRGFVAVHDRRLRADMHDENIAIHPSRPGLGLDIGMLDVRGVDRFFRSVSSRRQRLSGIALTHQTAGQKVSRTISVKRLDFWLLGGLGIKHCWAFRPCDWKVVQIRRASVRGLNRDEGDGFTPKTGVSLGQHGLICKGRDNTEAVDPGDIFGREHRNDVRVARLPGPGIAKREIGPVVGRADRVHLDRSARHQVRSEYVRALYFLRAIETHGRRSDRSRHLCLACALFNITNSIEDLAVAGATAQDPAQRVLRLGAARRRIALQQGGRRDQHTRRTDPALRCTVVQERLLQTVETFRGQSLNRRDLVAYRLRNRNEAGANRRSIEQHGAGAAIASIAA